MLGNILILETSTESGSVAIARDGALVTELAFSSRDHLTGARSEALAPAVCGCLAQAGMSARDLAAIVCGAGPGGFTSLRTGAALAKGLCSVLRLPLYGVSSLDLLARSADVAEGTYVAALHAGRNEWFASDVSRVADGTVTASPVYLIGDEELHARAVRLRAQLIGHGLDHEAVPRASAAIQALPEIEAAGPVDLDAWEPVYGRLAEAQVKWEAAHGRPLGG